MREKPGSFRLEKLDWTVSQNCVLLLPRAREHSESLRRTMRIKNQPVNLDDHRQVWSNMTV
jgi:hypothetical protein